MASPSTSASISVDVVGHGVVGVSVKAEKVVVVEFVPAAATAASSREETLTLAAETAKEGILSLRERLKGSGRGEDPFAGGLRALAVARAVACSSPRRLGRRPRNRASCRWLPSGPPAGGLLFGGRRKANGEGDGLNERRWRGER